MDRRLMASKLRNRIAASEASHSAADLGTADADAVAVDGEGEVGFGGLQGEGEGARAAATWACHPPLAGATLSSD